MKNKPLIITLAVIGTVLLILAVSLISTYNSLNGLRSEVEEKEAVISTQLERRASLIPNLVNTVKGYAAHEEGVYTAIAEARSKLNNAGSFEEQAAANAELDAALSRLLVIVEQYPELKANENFIALQDQLEGTENRIAVARNDYNAAVKEFNKKLRSFPTNLFGGMFGFSEFEYFEASEGANEVPNVSFE